MPNPALNDKTFAPERLRTLDPMTAPSQAEAWRDTMTLDGVVLRALTLFPILLATGWFGWQAVDRTELGADIPGWLFPVAILGFILAMVTIFKPKASPVTAPIYAAVEGLFLGAVSAVYEIAYEGIVLQAVLLTGAVFAIMLGLYSKRIVKVDARLQRAIIAATAAIMVVYLITIVASLFGAEIPMIHESGPVGIIFSLVVVGVAAANLLLDFDFIEKGVAARAPKWMEWYAAFGLFVTLIWLYLELLRLLSKLRDR